MPLLRIGLAMSFSLIPALAAGAAAPALAAAGGGPAACPPVSSPAAAAPPDWRDQVIYFLMIDRFDDGEPGNNDQGAGEYDPADPSRFSGGDLAGACRRLDYIQGLGATAVWITPPVANQWWNGRSNYGGYHGYWASDFMAVDPHFGTLDGYRRFADALHARGMSLVQDIVVNHTGDFFHYPRGHEPADPAEGHTRVRDSRPVPAPTRWPFTLNDPRRAEDLAAGIYHWTPAIRDYKDPAQVFTHALADLDDLDTENPVVRRALRESYGHWIREVGVDAFRVDTAFYVPPDYFRDFLYADDPRAPGVLEVARETGRGDFLLFGEGFAIDKPFEQESARRIETYVRDGQGPLLPGMLDFPLYGSLGEVFARGRPTAELGYRIRSRMQVHSDPTRLVTFLDNHDVERFLAGGPEPGLRQGLLALMTLPGIPVIYYGTEQGFRGQRAAMFAAGQGSDGRDHFDREAPLYRYLARATALRREHPLFSRGTPTVLREDAAGAGVLAWRMDAGDARALVVFNTADEARLLDNLDTGLPPGRRLRLLFSAGDDAAPAATTDARGRLSLWLPARAGLVWIADEDVPTPAAPAGKARLELAPLPDTPVRGALTLSGRAQNLARVQLLVDGRPVRAPDIVPGADGRWQARLDTRGWVDPAIRHRLVAWSEAEGLASESREFRVDPAWLPAAERSDPAGDDTGPDGRYTYPDDPAWRATRPGDLLGLRASVSGGSLQLELRMAGLLDEWNSPNGFDHVNLTVFLELPGRDGGARVMPQQDALLPGDLRWHYRWRLGGWSNAVFSAEGATATDEGRPASPAPRFELDRHNRTLRLTLGAETLGWPETLAGARLYVATWDYDGGYRPLQAVAGPFQFGGGDSDGAKVLDDSGIVVLRPPP